jgi:hypothetical protein
MLDQAEESLRITKDKFPDLGVTIPNGEKKQKCRLAIRRCIDELIKQDNLESFLSSVLLLFESFGITENPSQVIWNRNKLSEAYNEWQVKTRERRGGGFYIDLEFRTEKNGYANIYIFQDFTAGDSVRVIPGACSEGNSRPANQEFLPVLNFAKSVSAVSGYRENWLEKNKSTVNSQKRSWKSFFRGSAD